MPGYAIDPIASKSFTSSDEATVDNIINKYFVGFREDAVSGGAQIEILDTDEDIIVIPDGVMSNPNDYRLYFWTRRNIRFFFNQDNPGHLIMEVL